MTASPSVPLRIAALGAALALAGCAVGPAYHRPAAAVPAAFKEAEGWKQASPGDAAPRGPWWEAFGDPLLNELEPQVAVSNLTLRQAAAAYEQARQAARADRATFLPSLSADGSAQRGRSSSAARSSSGSAVANSYSASLQANWEPDLWGRLRRTTEADVAAAQASAADLANARLSLQAALAGDYVALRAADERRRLLDDAAAAYARTLTISQNKYRVGVSPHSDVLSAQAQLDATRAAAIDAGVQRAQLEHAIAVLLGRAPAEFSIAPRPALGLPVPPAPRAVPSDLLERRPDVAAAERSAAAANARVGVQTAAYFPSLSLTGEAGYDGSALHRLFEYPNRFWTLGASAAETLFDWGQRRAQLEAARAAYDASADAYRGTVLTALQQVEDQLAALRILEAESAVQDNAVAEAAQATRIAFNEYKAGTADYTTVATAEVAELNDREQALATRAGRLTASVSLIAALGGGWEASALPSGGEVMARRSSPAASVAAPR